MRQLLFKLRFCSCYCCCWCRCANFVLYRTSKTRFIHWFFECQVEIARLPCVRVDIFAWPNNQLGHLTFHLYRLPQIVYWMWESTFWWAAAVHEVYLILIIYRLEWKQLPNEQIGSSTNTKFVQIALSI